MDVVGEPMHVIGPGDAEIDHAVDAEGIGVATIGRDLYRPDENQLGRRCRVEIAALRSGVVIGDSEKIEARLAGRRVQRFGRAGGIGMEGVAMEVALVPPGP